MQKYDVVLLEKEGEAGITMEEAVALFLRVNGKEAYPIEILSHVVESCAMGFITKEAANKLDFDYIESGFMNFITNIMDDMNNETETGEYQFGDIKVLLTRNI